MLEGFGSKCRENSEGYAPDRGVIESTPLSFTKSEQSGFTRCGILQDMNLFPADQLTCGLRWRHIPTLVFYRLKCSVPSQVLSRVSPR